MKQRSACNEVYHTIMRFWRVVGFATLRTDQRRQILDDVPAPALPRSGAPYHPSSAQC